MKTNVGLWIDHRKAVIVFVTEKGEKIRLISGPQDSPPDDMHENEFTGHLNIYFDRVIECIRDAKSILMFGPGEAKGELKKRIDHPEQIVGVETAGKMTDRQIVAKVRGRFLVPVRKLRLERRGGSLRQSRMN